MKKLIVSALLTLLIGGNILAQELQLAGIFGNHMVIQQGIHVPVWGKSAPEATVQVDFAGVISVAKADKTGRWMTYLPPFDYGGPYSMKVTGADTIVLKNVMVGEVWLASGQSNMEWTVGAGVGSNTNQEIEEADYPAIRYFNVPKKTSIVPLETMEPKNWLAVTSETVKQLSAVSYFFARELHRHKGVAVGIVSASWGATSAEAWMSADILAAHPDFTERVKKLDRNAQTWNRFVEKNIENDRTRDSLARASGEGIKLKVHNQSYNHSEWPITNFPILFSNIGLGGYWGVVWVRKEFNWAKENSRNDLNLTTDIQTKEATIFINGKKIGQIENTNGRVKIKIPDQLVKPGKNLLAIKMYVNWGNGRIGTNQTPAEIAAQSKKTSIELTGQWSYNAKIEPPLPQWQNYYNTPTVQYNARIAPLIPFAIKGVIWYQGENNASKAYQYRSLFPLLISDWRTRWGEGYMPFLFVQLANFKPRKTEPSDDDWAELRESQMRTLSYPNTGMAVAIDLGEANDIHPRNKLDVAKRLYMTARHIAYNETIVYSGPQFESMQIEGNKIRLHFTSTGNGLTTSDNRLPAGFTIAGSDQRFCQAKAEIDGESIVVSAEEVPHPEAVRYGWASNPDCNLCNKERLPASPFRTDNWNLTTQP